MNLHLSLGTFMERKILQQITNTVRLNLIRLRREKGMSQMQLANEIGYSQAFINQLETGGKEINIEQAYKIITALGCSINDLLPNVQLKLEE